MTLNISWKTLQHLEQEYGDAFFVVDLNEFERNFFEFRDAFRNIYPRSQIAYSYKTNYMPRLCQLVNAWGGYAEVVSRMEYDLARKIGVPLDRIVFNGPYKTADDIATALQGRSLLNLDSPYQIDILRSLLRESGRLRPPVQIGLRAHFDVDGQTSRFG